MNGRPARTYLFVPGDRPERIAKALACGADAIVIDLEDAVAPANKERARAALAAWSGSQPAPDSRVVVRINGDASPWCGDDLAMLRHAGLGQVMLPKAESPAQVARITCALPAGGSVIALVETAAGVVGVDAIAGAPQVVRLAFGTIDYALDLDLPDDPRGLWYPCSRIALASRAVGLPPPIAGVSEGIGDTQALLDDLAMARACGFGAKLCIHPSQVAPVHRALAPTAEQIAWAERVLAAGDGEQGALQVDGRMVDRPLLLKAQALLARRDD